MNARVTLTDGEIERSVIARQVAVEGSLTRVMGADPSQYPDEFRDHICFTSNNLSAMFPHDPDGDLASAIPGEKEIKVVKIELTDEPVPDPQPSF